MNPCVVDEVTWSSDVLGRLVLTLSWLEVTSAGGGSKVVESVWLEKVPMGGISVVRMLVFRVVGVDVWATLLDSAGGAVSVDVGGGGGGGGGGDVDVGGSTAWEVEILVVTGGGTGGVVERRVVVPSAGGGGGGAGRVGGGGGAGGVSEVRVVVVVDVVVSFWSFCF